MGPHVILQQPTGLTRHQQPTGLTVRTCGMGVGLTTRPFLVPIIDMGLLIHRVLFLILVFFIIFDSQILSKRQPETAVPRNQISIPILTP